MWGFWSSIGRGPLGMRDALSMRSREGSGIQIGRSTVKQNLSPPMMKKIKESYKASECSNNDVNGIRVATPNVASGRRVNAPQVVTMRSPQTTTNVQHNNQTNLYNILQIRGDGNCLFRAVSLYLHDTQEQHMKIRQEAVSYVRLNWNEVKDHLVTTDPLMRNARNYCYAMRQEKTQGTSIEILAMSDIYHLQFNIHTTARRQNNKAIYLQTTTNRSL